LWIAAVARLRRWTEVVLPVKDEIWVEQKRLCGRCRGEIDIHISLQNLSCGVVNNTNVFTIIIIIIIIITATNYFNFIDIVINPLNAELNPISHLLALLGAHPILHVSRLRVKFKFLRIFIIYFIN